MDSKTSSPEVETKRNRSKSAERPVNKKLDYKPNKIVWRERNKKKVVRPRIRIPRLRYGQEKRRIINMVMKTRFRKKQKVGSEISVDVGKVKPGEKESSRKLLVKKPPAYYPTEPIRRKVRRTRKQVPCKLKKSLVPGTICILVAGPHKGKRVVFLKQLKSGLCLITGPRNLNRCPLRRINQIYMIGTQTRLNLGRKFKLPEHLNDEYFRRMKLKKNKKEDIFDTTKLRYRPTKQRKIDQLVVDKQVTKALNKDPRGKELGSYMCHKFSLKNGQYPHLLKF